jgi:hypothetical protein
MRGPRLSIAWLMALVAIIALDCALLVQIIALWDRSAALAVCLLIDGMPLITGAGVAVVLASQPAEGRSPPRRGTPGREP